MLTFSVKSQHLGYIESLYVCFTLSASTEMYFRFFQYLINPYNLKVNSLHFKDCRRENLIHILITRSTDHTIPAILLTIAIIAGIMLSDMRVTFHYSGRIYAANTAN
jgi:hypothetical protein